MQSSAKNDYPFWETKITVQLSKSTCQDPNLNSQIKLPRSFQKKSVCSKFQMHSAQKQLTELQDRHDEFIKLEKSIREVHDMFLEIANLVTTQVLHTTKFVVSS